MAATYVLTVDGTPRAPRLGSVQLQAVINGRDVLTCAIASAAGAYRPAIGDEVEFAEDGTPIFGGFIEKTYERGAGRIPNPDIETEIECVAYNVFADRRFITETVASGTLLKTFLTNHVLPYLSAYGVTLDPAQVNGPALPALEFDGVQLSQALDQVTTITTFPWEIDASKVLRMFQPGTVAAPVNVVDGDRHHFGDIVVERSRRNYVNRVIVKAGTNIVSPTTDTFTGDGTTDTFTLSFTIAVGTGHPFSWQGVVFVDGVAETLDVAGAGSGATWEYDASAGTITRTTGAPVLNAVITIQYDAQFPFTVTAQDATEISNNGIFEAVFEYPTVFNRAQAVAIADELLAQGISVETEVTLDTHEPGILPGQSMTITAAARNINTSFLVSEVQLRSLQDRDGNHLVRTVKAIAGTTFKGSFRDVYRAWLGGGVSRTSTVGPAVTVGSPSAGATLFFASRQLTHSEIVNLGSGSNDIEIVAAPNAGYAVVPLFLWTSQLFITAYTGNSDWILRYGGEITHLVDVVQFSATQGGAQWTARPAKALGLLTADVENKSIVVYAGNPTPNGLSGGHASNTLTVMVAYLKVGVSNAQVLHAGTQTLALKAPTATV